jgi:hypothetical protein
MCSNDRARATRATGDRPDLRGRVRACGGARLCGYRPPEKPGDLRRDLRNSSKLFDALADIVYGSCDFLLGHAELLNATGCFPPQLVAFFFAVR